MATFHTFTGNGVQSDFVYTFVILTRPDVIEWFGGRGQPAIGR